MNPPSRDLPEFMWTVGIEDTFVPQPHRRTGRILDEYELTQHYRFWREDLDRIASLGVRYVRYGIPWYRVNPEPDRFDWSWTDQVLRHLDDLHLVPIVDLMHYGCPLWLKDAFLNPGYPERVAEYAAAFVERYGARARFYTPLNEPIVNAWFCGRAGSWPPYRRGPRGYFAVLVALARGMSRTVAEIRARRPDAVIVQVEASERVVAESPALHEAWWKSLEQQFLATDLLLGRVHPEHATWDRLVSLGLAPADLEWLATHPQRIDVMGLNFYPRLSNSRLSGTPDALVYQPVYATAADLHALLAAYHEHFGVPVMITETSDLARVHVRERWMEESVAGVRSARAAGVPVVGYTWFPVFSHVSWNYRGGTRPLRAYLIHMGLWELHDDGDGVLRRVPTALVDRFAEIVASDHHSVGTLQRVGRDGG